MEKRVTSNVILLEDVKKYDKEIYKVVKESLYDKGRGGKQYIRLVNGTKYEFTVQEEGVPVMIIVTDSEIDNRLREVQNSRNRELGIKDKIEFRGGRYDWCYLVDIEEKDRNRFIRDIMMQYYEGGEHYGLIGYYVNNDGSVGESIVYREDVGTLEDYLKEEDRKDNIRMRLGE